MLRPKPRIANTGEKVRNVLVIIWREELEREGITYGDVLAYMDNLQVKCAISPWHDRDVWDEQGVLNWCTMHLNPETGDVDERYLDDAPYVGKTKKAHAHVLVKVPSQQTAQWFSTLFCGLIRIEPTRWEKCMDVEASLCYFAHLHSPLKAPYDVGGIHAFGGLDTSCLHRKTENDKTEMLNAAHDLIEICHVRYYYQLVDVCREQSDELLAYVSGKHGYFQSYLGSQRWEKRDKAEIERNVEK